MEVGSKLWFGMPRDLWLHALLGPSKYLKQWPLLLDFEIQAAMLRTLEVQVGPRFWLEAAASKSTPS